MVCEELMKQQVECVTPQDSAEAAARRMRDENVGFLPVCDASKKVLGTITDRDIAIRLVASGKPASAQVSDVMTHEVVACNPKDDIVKAEGLMGRNHKSRIMCIDDAGRLVGVISLSDIAQRDRDHAAQTLQEVSQREAQA
jgi:CBS domain-containing protein